MPRMDVITKLIKRGEPATVELPGGMWTHSAEYFKLRYPEGRKRGKQGPSEAKLEILLGNLTPSEKVLLLAKLDTQGPQGGGR